MASRKIGDWTATATLSLILRKRNMLLHIGVTPTSDPDIWGVLAIETPSKAAGGGPQAVLDHHAHKLVGTFDFSRAIREAEGYARRWRPSKTVCDCSEITGLDSKPPTTRRQ